MFPKKKTYQIDMEQANAALQNVFAACNEAPNTVPIDRLLLHQAAHKRTYDIFLRVIIVLLLLTLLSPLPFLCFMQTTNASPIVLEEHYVKGDKLYLELDFGNHTIKFEEAYLVSPGGTIYEIVSYDSQTHVLCFPYIAQACSIYIPYDENSLLHLQLEAQ